MFALVQICREAELFLPLDKICVTPLCVLTDTYPSSNFNGLLLAILKWIALRFKRFVKYRSLTDG